MTADSSEVVRPTVSVVIPSNRGGPFLAEAVASLRAQTVAPYEIILVDDGSPAPGLADIAHELGVRYVRQDAAGVSVARNRGVAVASGEWVGFLDDDDLWYPDKIEAQLALLHSQPDAIALYSDMSIIDPQSVVFAEVTAPVGTSLEMMGMGRSVIPPITSLLIRRETYITVGGCEPGLQWAEDLDLILRLLWTGEFAKAGGSLVGYRKHANQISSRQWPSNAAYLAVVRALIVRARRAMDAAAGAALQQHLARTISPMADWWAGEMVSRLRHRRLRDAFSALRWGLRNLRFAVVPGLVRTVPRKLLGR